MVKRHHCPGASGPVNGESRNCRRSHNNTHCTTHQNYCPNHKIAFMKGKNCVACIRGLRPKKDKKDGDKKDDDKDKASSSKTVKGKASKVTKNSGKKSSKITAKGGKKTTDVKATAIRLARGGVGITFSQSNIRRLLNILSARQWISLRSRVNVVGLDDILLQA